MAISVDWGTGVITVNQTDPEVTLISGTTYELDTNAFRLALRALEESEEGMAFLPTHTHNTTYSIDGLTYVRSFEIINGYTIQVLPNTSWRLRMDGGSNNNFHSEGILVLNNVQVIPNNSAGALEVGTSGLTAGESALLTQAADEAELARKLIDADKVLSDGSSGNLVLTDSDDGTTVLRTKSVVDKSGGAIVIPDDFPAEETRD